MLHMIFLDSRLDLILFFKDKSLILTLCYFDSKLPKIAKCIMMHYGTCTPHARKIFVPLMEKLLFKVKKQCHEEITMEPGRSLYYIFQYLH